MEDMDKTKIALVLFLIVSLFICAALFLSCLQMKQSLKQSQEQMQAAIIQMKDLENSIKRSQSSYVTSQYLDDSLSKLGMSEIKSDLKNLNAKLSAINIVSVRTPGKNATNLVSTGTKPRPSLDSGLPASTPCIEGSCINPDKFNYLNNEQELSINEPFSDAEVPFGKTSFKAWEGAPWSLQVFQRNYVVSNTLSQTDEGQYVVHNKFEIEVQGKKYPVKIAESTTIQAEKESEFWFNPKIYLGLGVGSTITPEFRAEVVPTIGAAIFSYGPNKKQSTLSFLNVGIAAHTQELAPALTISPVNYNIGEPIPLLENLFIGPTVSVDTNANVSISGSIQVGL